ncbi:MAG: hypothetical protein LQ338_006619 [Usnochroma carphineum]|nr:MAG: hypothetical protein LQ338_006619 [Usnochroma carphineum]
MTSTAEQQWPPRSPFEALLSSPSGRSRVRRSQDRSSPSPSPLKNGSTRPVPSRWERQTKKPLPPAEEEDDEDEETLQLRLQALEAKLKLKRLQQKRNKHTSSNSDIENRQPIWSPAGSAPSSKSAAEENDWVKLEQPSTTTASQAVQIPASPQRKPPTKGAPKSPGRVLLGIDKGLKGRNVTLRKPPGTKSSQVLDDPFLEHALQARNSSQRSNQQVSKTRDDTSRSRPMTFSERIADSRQQDKEQREKTRKLQDQRSTGFGIGQEALELMKTNAEEEAKIRSASSESSSAKPTFTRDEVLKAASKPNGGLLHRGNICTANRAVTRQKEFKNPNAPPEVTMPAKQPMRKRSPSSKPAKTKISSSKVPDSADASLFEPFSSVHLSKRLIPHDSLTKAFTGKSILLLPNVLATVKAPDYSFADDLEPDIIVVATIASKSIPLAHKDHHKTADKPPLPSSTDNPKTSLAEAAESENNERGKYMALTLTDLKWTLDLYLFTSAFTRFRKLSPGTVIAVLNPNIMPPPPHNPHNNRFSLTLNSNEDTILEIGTSRDLGWCSSLKRDGKQCEAWIDKRHTSVCEFHVDRVIEKTRRGRMEINGVNTGFAPGGRKSSRSGFWGGGGAGSGDGKRYTNSQSYAAGHFQRKEQAKINRLLPEGQQYDRVNKACYFVGGKTGFGQSAASLLDADGLAERGGREERVRRRLAEREREREIARSLGERGSGMGGEYLKVRQEVPGEGSSSQGANAAASQKQRQEPVDAAALGLKGNKAGDVQLSPLKKRRIGKRTEEEGARKRTRFVTERGIKEAGRESLGVIGGSKNKEGEDDTDLDIV